MAEVAFRSVQIGKESVYGTEVDATIVLPVETTAGELTLTRGTNTPDEDYARAIRNHSGRASHGVRLVSGQVSSVATFQTLPHLLQMALGGVTTTGSASPFTHVIDSDATSDSTESYTWEVNDDTQDWIGTGLKIVSFELGFDAIAAGENAPWMFSGDLQGVDLGTGTATASLTAPACETMEGHLTTLAEGTTATAFASLTTLSSKLRQFSLSYACPKPPRAYAGSDKHTEHGREKGLGTINALLKEDSTTLASTWTIFNVAGAVPTYRRWRLSVDGSGVNAATIDMQVKITDVHIENTDNERLISVVAETVDDSTLDTDLEISITNATSSY